MEMKSFIRRSPWLAMGVGILLLLIDLSFPQLKPTFKAAHIPDYMMDNAPWWVLLTSIGLVISSASFILFDQRAAGRVIERLASLRTLRSGGIREILPSDIDLDKTPLFLQTAELWIVLHDGHNFLKRYKGALRDRFEANSPTHIIILDEEAECVPSVAQKSGKALEEQLSDIASATAFVFEQQRASPASNVHLYKTRRTMTYSFFGNRSEGVLSFYPTAQRWEHRLTLRLAALTKNEAEKSYLAQFLDDVEMTRRSAREIV